MITVMHGQSAFGGKLVLSREFFNPETKNYIHIEAHEIDDQELEEEERPGHYRVAFWVPDGNDGPHGFDGNLRHVVESMQKYTPPAGYVEMDIPEEHY